MIKTKMQLAHEMALAIQGTKLLHDMELVSDMAWKYADAMQAEADKRNKAEAEQKRKEMREMLNAPNTFVEREGQHFDDVEEWQPDWSQAPKWANWWVMTSKGVPIWIDSEPRISDNGFYWCLPRGNIEAPLFNYQGDWRESLRERPL